MQDEAAGAAPSAQVVQAQAEADRLRLQYQNLIRAMAHDAQELATAAGALAGAQIGFERRAPAVAPGGRRRRRRRRRCWTT